MQLALYPDRIKYEMFFYDERKNKIPAVTKKQMKGIERLAIEEFGPNLFQMMENA